MAVGARNRAFDLGLLRARTAGVPVISVGNMTAGGTGKTPLVEFIVQHAIGRGKRVAVISRGYGRVTHGAIVVSDGRRVLVDAVQGGDEPVQIARKFPEAFVVVGERRVEAAHISVERFRPDVIILDDGFQHRYLSRSVDIVVIDSTRDLRVERMIPVGVRREAHSGLKRAHVIAFSKFDGSASISDLKDKLYAWFTGPVTAYRYKIKSVHRLVDNSEVPLSDARKEPAMAFSGIGHHIDFVNQLRNSGFTVQEHIEFPDHHWYSVPDVERIVKQMKQGSAAICVTTEKDAMRLSAHKEILDTLRPYPVFYPRIAVEIVHGKAELLSLIDKCLEGEGS